MVSDKACVKCVAIVGIVTLEAIALGVSKIDGAALAAVVGVVAGIAGFEVGKKS